MGDRASNEKKIVFLEIIRIIAICLVVINHTDINYYYYHDTSNIFTFFVSLLFTILCTADVPLFYMVSGALLLQRNESLRTLFTKRILRMVLVIILFSALQYLLKFFRGQIERASIIDFVQKTITGDIQPTYWFLYSYLGFIIILPFLRRMAQNMQDNEFVFLIIIKIVVDLILPIEKLLSFDFYNSTIMNSLQLVLSDGWYFLVGFYFTNFESKKKKIDKKNAILLLIAAVLIPFLLISFEFYSGNTLNDDYLKMTTAILTISIFIISMNLFSNERYKNNKIIPFFGKHVFGAYLTEFFARAVFLPLYKFLICHVFGVVACGIYIIASLTLAFIFSYILSRIPWIKKLI